MKHIDCSLMFSGYIFMLDKIYFTPLGRVVFIHCWHANVTHHHHDFILVLPIKLTIVLHMIAVLKKITYARTKAEN